MKKKGTGLLLKMAWRNLWRQRRRTLITLFAMAAGLAFSIPTYGLMMGLSAQMTEGITGMHLGNIQIHQKKYPEERRMRQMLPYKIVRDAVEKIDEVTALAPRVYSGGMISSERNMPTKIKGLPKKAIRSLPLVHGVHPQKPCEGLLDQATAKSLRIRRDTVLMLHPLPPMGACEKITVSGIVMGTTPQMVVFEKTARKIFAPVKEPPKEEDDDGDDDDDDLDNLKKLPAGGEEGAPAEKEKEILGPAQGTWSLVKLYSHPVGIVAVRPVDERQVSTMSKGIVKGHYLSNTFATEKGKRGIVAEVVIGVKLAKILKVKVGSVVGMDMGTVHNYALDRMFKVVGIFKTGLPDMDRGLVYVHIANAWDKDLMGVRTKGGARGVHEYAIKISNERHGAKVAAAIREVMPQDTLVRTWQQIEPSMANIMKTQEAMTGLILAIILLIASFGTMNTMLMAVMERIKEFGVLKSIGMKPSRVGILIMIETFLLALTASALGGAIGVGLQQFLVKDGIDLTFIMPDGFSFQGVIIDPVWRAQLTARGIIIPVVLLFVISMVVAIWPAIRAARIKPVEAFRNNG